jgi:methionine-rich copper-binding protein CopC
VFERPSVQFGLVTLPDRAPWRLSLAAIAATLSLMLPAVVAAHTELETATPAAGSTVPSPFEGPIVLTFSEDLADGSKAELLGPDGDVLANANVDGPAAEMSFELDAALDPGDYEIEWTGVAIDGHVERGTIEFTVAPPRPSPTPTPEPEPTTSATPAAPSPEPTPSASPLPTPTPTGTGAAADSDVVLPIVVGLLIVLVGAASLLSRRGRPTL